MMYNQGSQRRGSSAVSMVIVLCLGVSILGLSSCGGTEIASSTLITFGCFSHEKEFYRELADKFEQAHPEVEIQLREIDTIFESARPTEVTVTLRELAETVDTFTWFNAAIAEAGHLRLLYDLQPFLVQRPEAESDWLPASLDAFRWKGNVYALPIGVKVPVMFYNKDLFDGAGVSYPQKGWTWEQFRSRATHLTVGEGSKAMQYGYADLSGRAPAAFVYQHEGRLRQDQADAASSLPLPMFDNPRTVEALTWYTALVTDQRVMPNPAQVEQTAVRSLIAEGKMAMWSDFASQSGRWRQRISAVIGTAPLPRDVVEASPLLAKGYAVSAGTRSPQISYRWIEYLSRQSGTVSLGEEWLPAQESALRARYREMREEDVETVHYVLTHSAQPVDQALASYISDMDVVFAGETTIEDFLTEAQQQALTQHEAIAAADKVSVTVATPAPRGSRRRATITFGFLGSDGEKVDSYKDLAQAFMALHPDVAVRVKSFNVEGSISGKMMADRYDVFLWNDTVPQDCTDRSGETSELNECSRVVLDLTPFVDVSDFSLNDFSPAGLTPLSDEGRLWGIPLTLDTTVAVFYNRTLFDQAGILYPQDGWTWDDFLTKAKQLTEGEGDEKQYGFLSRFWAVGDVLLYLGTQGVTPVDTTTSPPTFYLNTDEMKTAMEWWVDLDTKWGVVPPMDDMLSWNTGDILRSGRVAMWTDLIETRNYREFYSKDVEVGVAPLPRGVQSVGPTEQQVIYISANTKHPLECWKWLRYLSDHLPPAPLAPVRISQLHSEDFRQHVGEDIASVYLAAVEADLNLGEHEEFYKVTPYLETALQAVVSGADVDRVLEEAQRQAEKETSSE